ncbi:hypothetical protein [Pseudalkalibacillus berkeleyi]|uniref:SWIM-type domain-containing protein n=1 Tax=Pseudalkalibacillus berkeleyi TaxID=1069813 RepID=A0ABS9GWZ6_9BACL|nr:hypothetical protein [Pseudalkalibacillus berkeleyi]MCF6137307.1 hypothetical protein [Pseudalkalibacillus berkeleyi]
MKNRRNAADSKLQQWLNRFSENVDYSRFQHGMKLYNAQSVHDFHVYPNHFECIVEGNLDEYQVKGYYSLSDGAPLLKDYEITCNCPDDVDVCKHSVCATMYFILNELDDENNPSDEKVQQARKVMIEEPLAKLELDVNAQNVTLLDLHKHRGSRVIDNRDYIERVHERIMKVMDELKERE